MRIILIAMLVACLFTSTRATGEDSLGDKAIKDAIKLLQARYSRAKKPEDNQKLREAMDVLEEIVKPPKKSEVPVVEPGEVPVVIKSDEISNLIDSPDKYRKKLVTANLEIASLFLDSSAGLSIRTWQGVRDVKFADAAGGVEATILIYIPKGIDIPQACYGEEVVVTFRCGDGELKSGNVAVKVERPKK